MKIWDRGAYTAVEIMKCNFYRCFLLLSGQLASVYHSKNLVYFRLSGESSRIHT